MEHDYRLMFETVDVDDAGTDDDVWVTLYDVNGKKIGDAFEVTEALHDEYGDALKRGSVQSAVYTVPMSGSVHGKPRPVFMSVEIKGDDTWLCHKITAIRREVWEEEEQRMQERIRSGDISFWSAAGALFNSNKISEFIFDKVLSTDSDEDPGVGKIDKFPEKRYCPSSTPKPRIDQRSATTYWIGNNARGTTSTSPQSCAVKLIDGETISLTRGDGTENSHSIATGVTVAYGVEGGPSGEVSTNVENEWKKWANRQKTRCYDKSAERTKEVKDICAPAKTISIRRWKVPFEVAVFEVTNGLERPVEITMIKEQKISFGAADVRVWDINEDNKISEVEWKALSKDMESSSSVSRATISEVENDLNRENWIER